MEHIRIQKRHSQLCSQLSFTFASRYQDNMQKSPRYKELQHGFAAWKQQQYIVSSNLVSLRTNIAADA